MLCVGVCGGVYWCWGVCVWCCGVCGDGAFCAVLCDSVVMWWWCGLGCVWWWCSGVQVVVVWWGRGCGVCGVVVCDGVVLMYGGGVVMVCVVQ